MRAALDEVLAMDADNESLLIELTEIPAPPFMEEVRAAHYLGLVREAGFEGELDEIGNVLARIEGTVGDRTIAVVAHLDTVFPEGTDVTVRRDGDKLMAPGIADDTRGLVTMLTTMNCSTATASRPGTTSSSWVPWARRGSATCAA